MHPTVRRTWAPKGQTPILRQRGRSHQKVSTIGALSISPRRRRMGLYLHWHPGRNITREELIDFLDDLLRHLRGPVILVWDRLNAHRSVAAGGWRAVYPRLHFEWLPPYAPELNPMEYVWGNLKGHKLANHAIHDLGAIQQRAEGEAEILRRRQPLLRSFVHAAQLPIDWNG
jgi:transposase